MTIPVPQDAMTATRWKWFFAVGAVFAILGVLALGNVVTATYITTIVVGVLLLVAGAVQVIGAFASGGSMGWRVLGFILGILYLLIGFNIVADPFSGALAITFALAIFLIVGGVVRLVSAFTAAGANHRVLLFISGVIDLALGLWVWTGVPLSGLAIGLFVGVDLLVAGVIWMVLAWTSRRAAPIAQPV